MNLFIKELFLTRVVVGKRRFSVKTKEGPLAIILSVLYAAKNLWNKIEHKKTSQWNGRKLLFFSVLKDAPPCFCNDKRRNFGWLVIILPLLFLHTQKARKPKKSTLFKWQDIYLVFKNLFNCKDDKTHGIVTLLGYLF